MSQNTPDHQPEPEYREIQLTQGQVAIVDPQDFDWLSEKKWFAYYCKRMRSFYARHSTWLGGGKRGVDHMHREIMKPPSGFVIDHIDGDTLNNRRYNLRIVTQQQNCFNRHKLNRTNTSGFKGVYWCKQRSKWFAAFSVSGKRHWLGFFSTPEEASAAYEREAELVLGEFHNAIKK